jgi:two-component system chemotaxis response regulator CheY
VRADRTTEPRPLDVLVVAEDEHARMRLCTAVETLGHHFRSASRASEALRMHDARRADLIICDWKSAGTDRMDLCRRVRALDRDRYTYLLVLDGNATKRELVEAARAGADDCLAKSFTLDDLEARLVAGARVVHGYGALAEKNAHLRRDSQAFFRAARVDPLTGIPNRLRLEEDLAALQAQLTRYGRRVSIALCDIDGFKRYNDHHGHIAGDEALRRIAQAARDSIRRSDHIYRYGGEEFLVVLPEQGRAQAAAAMERVRAAVEALSIPHAPDGPHPVVTVSVGLATLSPDGMRSVGAAVARADRAMYRAKAEGGNTLVVGGDEPSRTHREVGDQAGTR